MASSKITFEKNKNITKYLTQYAEACIAVLENFPPDISFEYSVVIPAYKEDYHFIRRFFQSKLARQNALMLLVINQPDTDENKLPQQTLFNDVCSMGTIIWHCLPYTLIKPDKSNSCILILDGFSNALPCKQGVGVARKQGVDSVLALIGRNQLRSQWICSTDADATLPDSYFDAISQLNSSYVGACYNFYHQCEELEIHQANALYEQALRYYVAGLTYAGSNYNFFTIGSILAFTAQAYASVRGFPKRSAGEDFYLLNKLAKLGNIAHLNDHTIKLTARRSDRVPFGTGPAVNTIIALQQQKKEYTYYHPQVFILLKEVLTAFNFLFENANTLEQWLTGLSLEAKDSILSLGFVDFIGKQNIKQQNTANKKQFYKQLNVWFDAFKTLKFIHFVKNNYWADIPLKTAIKEAPFVIKT